MAREARGYSPEELRLMARKEASKSPQAIRHAEEQGTKGTDTAEAAKRRRQMKNMTAEQIQEMEAVHRAEAQKAGEELAQFVQSPGETIGSDTIKKRKEPEQMFELETKEGEEKKKASVRQRISRSFPPPSERPSEQPRI